RPALDPLPAVHADVVLVLRPRTVRPADLTRELRHPVGGDVPRVRTFGRDPARDVRHSAVPDAEDQSDPDADHTPAPPRRLVLRHEDAAPDVPGVVDRASP